MNFNNDALRHVLDQENLTEDDLQVIVMCLLLYVAKIELGNIFLLLTEFKKSSTDNLAIGDIGIDYDIM